MVWFFGFFQKDKIRTALKLNFLNNEVCKVGTVEEFQGGERKVIIISTVRSYHEDRVDDNKHRLNFIYNPKRFNVMITRAKCMLIIVGNPHVLNECKYWKELLKFCIKLGAYKGESRLFYYNYVETFFRLYINFGLHI